MMAYNNTNTMHNISLHLLYAIIPCLAVNIVSLIFGTAIPTSFENILQ